MTFHWLIVLVVVVVAIVTVVIVKLVVRERTMDKASVMAKELFPIWAAQGPFDSGEESAAAMCIAHMAISGTALSPEAAQACMRHMQAYNADPVVWEQNRKLAEQHVNEEVLKRLERGKAVADEVSKDTDNCA